MTANIYCPKSLKMSPSPISQGIATVINPKNVSNIETYATETGKNTGHMRDITRMTVCTIVTPHVKIQKIGTNTKKTNLTGTIGDMPRLPMARTARVDIMPTTWTRATRGRIRAPAALNPPSRKSREFECPLLQGDNVIVLVLQVMMR